jgi:hypothetical protein
MAIGTAPINGTIATFTTNALGAGDNNIVATYTPNIQTTLQATASDSLTQTVTGGVVLPAAGIINTIAGNGTQGLSGEGPDGQTYAATSAQLSSPFGIVVDSQSNIFFADTENCSIREVIAATGASISLSTTISMVRLGAAQRDMDMSTGA